MGFLKDIASGLKAGIDIFAEGYGIYQANQIIQSYANQGCIIQGIVASQRLQQIVQRLSSKINNDYSIYLVNSGEINAISLCGNNIIVYTGMLNCLKSYDELAFVIAHEVMHSEQAHQIVGLKTNVLGEVLGSSAEAVGKAIGYRKQSFLDLFEWEEERGPIRTTLGNAVAILGRLGAEHYKSRVSQKDEYEADLLGAKLLIQSGLSPKGALSFFNTLNLITARNIYSKIETFGFLNIRHSILSGHIMMKSLHYSSLIRLVVSFSS